jgi:uncharacterized membrane protein
MLVRAVLAGAATGSRSLTGFAALTLSTPAGFAQPDRALGAGWVKALSAVAALQELVIDKLPNTPGRLKPAGLGARVAVGAAVGMIVARREWPPRSGELGPAGPAGGAAVVAPAVAAATAAVAAAWLGARWRQVAARHFGQDHAGAVIEDLAAMSLAWVAALS